MEKDISGSKAAEELLLGRLEKGNDENERLHKQVEAERSASRALSAQIDLLTKRLKEARNVGTSAAKVYQVALAGFGGATSPLLVDASTYGIFAWLRENFAKLPEFVGGAMDFGALSCATNLCKTLGKASCSHITSLKGRKVFEGPLELGESPSEVTKSIKNFMKFFWFKL